MEQKYIVGDIFLIDGQPRKITWIGSSYPRVDIDGIDVACKDSDLKPIPLTPEILEKNGWKKQKRGNGYVGFSFKRNKFPTIHFQGIELLYVNVPSISSIFLRYVHDLQHLLFGLGLDSNIKL